MAPERPEVPFWDRSLLEWVWVGAGIQTGICHLLVHDIAFRPFPKSVTDNIADILQDELEANVTVKHTELWCFAVVQVRMDDDIAKIKSMFNFGVRGSATCLIIQAHASPLNNGTKSSHPMLNASYTTPSPDGVNIYSNEIDFIEEYIYMKDRIFTVVDWNTTRGTQIPIDLATPGTIWDAERRYFLEIPASQQPTDEGSGKPQQEEQRSARDSDEETTIASSPPTLSQFSLSPEPKEPHEFREPPRPRGD
ncbi:hypothetical protein V8F06_002184 [Rhypophila decipiens]